MRRFLLGLLVGLVVGLVTGLVGGGAIRSGLPPALGGGTEEVIEGTVVAKRLEEDRLLLTVDTAQGSILATFIERMPEIDLLVEEGDTLTLDLDRYEPFVQEIKIERVRKPTRQPEPTQTTEEPEGVEAEPEPEGEPQTEPPS